MKKPLYLLPLAAGLLISQACLAAAPKAHEAACPLIRWEGRRQSATLMEQRIAKTTATDAPGIPDEPT